MKAVSARSYGSRDVLDLEEAPCPDIGPEDVLIRIAATSVNPFDWAVGNGYLTDYYTYSFPLILGLDVSGVVEVVGSEAPACSPEPQFMVGRTRPRTGLTPYISLYPPRR